MGVPLQGDDRDRAEIPWLTRLLPGATEVLDTAVLDTAVTATLHEADVGSAPKAPISV
ncbi:MAG: hypothetical protein AAFY11_11445 [Cyanobacteria bacterium J06641_5]